MDSQQVDEVKEVEEVEEEEEKKWKKKCFLTGGSGFVGYNILLELLAQEWEVTCLFYEFDKDFILKRLFDLRDDHYGQLHLVKGDILKMDSLRKAMPEGLDCVFHIAGSIMMNSKRNEFQRKINVDGTKNVLEVAVEKKVKKFIQTSSTSVFGKNAKNELINEETHKGAMEYPFNYGQTKLLGERIVLEAAKKGRIEAVAIEPNFILGENDLQGQGFTLMYNKVNRGLLPFVPGGGGSFGDVREIARAHVAAYDKGRNGECYILGGEFFTHKEFVALIAKELGIKNPPQYTPPDCLFYTLCYVLETVENCLGKVPRITTQQYLSTCRIVRVDSTKAEKELGFKVTPVKDLIKRQIAYMKEHDLLNREIQGH